jgi:murein L,D-transpeptidase YcbB/YkuD
MKVRLAVGIFLAFLPVLALAQTTTTAEQLLQALLPPNAATPKISAPISAPVTSSIATPSASNATLLQSLYAQLAVLETELSALEAAANQHSSCTPITTTRTLSLGSSGTDVSSLQQFLQAQGYLDATPTGYFGTMTQAAVAQFQKANNISPVGSVGPLTKAKITALTNSCTAGGGYSTTPSTNPPTATGS